MPPHKEPSTPFTPTRRSTRIQVKAANTLASPSASNHIQPSPKKKVVRSFATTMKKAQSEPPLLPTSVISEVVHGATTKAQSDPPLEPASDSCEVIHGATPKAQLGSPFQPASDICEVAHGESDGEVLHEDGKVVQHVYHVVHGHAHQLFSFVTFIACFVGYFLVWYFIAFVACFVGAFVVAFGAGYVACLKWLLPYSLGSEDIKDTNTGAVLNDIAVETNSLGGKDFNDTDTGAVLDDICAETDSDGSEDFEDASQGPEELDVILHESKSLPVDTDDFEDPSADINYSYTDFPVKSLTQDEVHFACSFIDNGLLQTAIGSLLELDADESVESTGEDILAHDDVEMQDASE